ncbi:MAG TPA: universal stress protein [Mycobacteriales bacterium]|nr:universal stress protein [Mycobacteriales bacterium]
MSDDKPVVVVGVDGSELSNKAVEWATRYAESTGATVQLVSAWQWALSYGAPMMYDGYDPTADAEAIVAKVRADVSLPAERVETVVREGQAGPTLVDASKGALALVVGSQGHSAISKILLGSVSSYCVHHAECPIVIVR